MSVEFECRRYKGIVKYSYVFYLIYASAWKLYFLKLEKTECFAENLGTVEFAGDTNDVNIQWALDYLPPVYTMGGGGGFSFSLQ